jgi:hypothetical protein
MQKQQGDVNLEGVDSIPKDAKKVSPEKRGFILAGSGVTAHAHRLEDIEGIEMFEKDGAYYIKISKQKILQHEKHKPIILEPGIWKSWIVKEYDHFAEEARNVLD